MRGVINTAPGSLSMRGWLDRTQNPILARCDKLYMCKLYHRAWKSIHARVAAPRTESHPFAGGCTAHQMPSLRSVINYISANYITASRSRFMRGMFHRAQKPTHLRCAELYHNEYRPDYVRIFTLLHRLHFISSLLHALCVKTNLIPATSAGTFALYTQSIKN